MSKERNKAVIRRFIEEALNRRNLAVADEVLAEDYVLHVPPNPDVVGRDGLRQFFSTLLAAFPDCHYTIEDMVAEGDKVAFCWTVVGTHKGELMGVPATGKKISLKAIGVVHMADGMMREDWSGVDFLGMMQQLGVVPAQ